MLVNESKRRAAKLSISPYIINLAFSILPQLCIVHHAHTRAHQIAGSTCVPGDQLVLKMHALNISHVNICVISTGARLELSREPQQSCSQRFKVTMGRHTTDAEF